MKGVTTLRRIGQAIDRRYLEQAGAGPIPGSELGLLLICYHPHHGKKLIELPDQTIIQPGQLVSELHFSNKRITEIADESQRSLEWQLLDMLKQELGTLAKACADGLISEEIQAFYGTNVLAAGARRLGFTLIPMPKGWNRYWVGFWESMLRLIYYSFKTSKKVSLKRTMDPYEIWMSRNQLVQRYLKPRKEV